MAVQHLKEPLVGRVDPGCVARRDEVEQEAARDGKSEPDRGLVDAGRGRAH